MSRLTQRTAFVTGAAGFLGRHLVERLVAEDWRVTAFCRPTDPVHLLPAEVDLRTGDLADAAGLERALPTDTDAVFHLAGNTSTWARHRHQQWADNVEGTAHVVDAVLGRRAGRLVATSSTSAYGLHAGQRINEQTVSNATTRGDPYGRSKFAAEGILRAAQTDRGLDAVILNPVNVLGAYDATNWSRQLILPIANGTLRAVPPGSATWISVHDVVAAHLRAVDLVDPAPSYVLGGVEASFLEVVNTIEELLGRPLTPRATSARVMKGLMVLTMIKGAVTRTEPELTPAKIKRAVGDLVVDDSLARLDLGLVHRPLVDQLGETIDWLRSVELLPAASASAHRSAVRL